jgi:3-oxoacyl-[acyl-carrier protein] reductase
MKCSLVTGGSKGIGKAICIKMAQMGYYVLVNYKSNKEAADDTLAQIRAAGGDGELLPFDVSDKGDVQRTLGDWVGKNGDSSIEVLVNNAGIKEDCLMLYMTDEQWEQVIRTNLDSFFFVTRLVLSGMLLNKYGRIINIVSLSGQKGLAGQTNYSAAKAGVIGATRSLAQEVGRYGITVNAVAPGLVCPKKWRMRWDFWPPPRPLILRLKFCRSMEAYFERARRYFVLYPSKTSFCHGRQAAFLR